MCPARQADDKQNDRARFSLTILSWNLAMFERSIDAPTYWGHSDIEAAVRQTVLDLQPDVVVLQELPGLVPFVETHDMMRSNPRSHSGNLATLVSHRLMATKPIPSLVHRAGLLTCFPDLDLTVANVHLAPGRGAEQDRRAQMHEILDTCETIRLVVIGDTNTRLSEEATMAELGFSIDRPPSPTWDGHRNRFRGDSGKFKAYFTRGFGHGPVHIESQQVIDDRPIDIDGSQFHVSDHFALMVTIQG